MKIEDEESGGRREIYSSNPKYETTKNKNDQKDHTPDSIFDTMRTILKKVCAVAELYTSFASSNHIVCGGMYDVTYPFRLL